MSRTRLFGAVGLIVALNALAGRIVTSLSKGFWLSLSETFGVSAIIWLALGIIAAITLSAPVEETGDDERLRPFEIAMAAIAVVFVTLTPSAMLSAGVLFPLALWGVAKAARGTTRHRAGLVLLALTLTLLWGPLALRFSPELLEADAHLAAWLIGTKAQGNIYTGPDGVHQYIVGAGCSSLNNLSLATIFAVSLTQYFGLALDRRAGFAMLLASLLTVAANISRLGVIALRPSEFEYWHNGQGSVIFAWLSLAAIVVTVTLVIDRRVPREAG